MLKSLLNILIKLKHKKGIYRKILIDQVLPKLKDKENLLKDIQRHKESKMHYLYVCWEDGKIHWDREDRTSIIRVDVIHFNENQHEIILYFTKYKHNEEREIRVNLGYDIANNPQKLTDERIISYIENELHHAYNMKLDDFIDTKNKLLETLNSF